MEEDSLESIASSGGPIMNVYEGESNKNTPSQKLCHVPESDGCLQDANLPIKHSSDVEADVLKADLQSRVVESEKKYLPSCSKERDDFGGIFQNVSEVDMDLGELDSNALSEQITKVVTKLDGQVNEDITKIHITPCTKILADSGNSGDNKIGKLNKDSDSLVNRECDDGMVGNKSDIQAEEVDNMSNRPDDVQIKVIEVPDDDDLFDFLKGPTQPDNVDESSNMSTASDKKTAEDIKKWELYRYLTVTDPTQIRSNEVTPCPSGDESDAESGTDRSGSTEGVSSESDSEDEQLQPQLTAEEESRPETPIQEEPLIDTPVRARRKPGPKPKFERPPKKPKRAPGQLSERTIEKLEKCREATNKWLKDLKVPEDLKFEKPLSLNIAELNQYLTCGLCKGYLYEASTITECMHTFCKNCIVRHCMEVSLHCPVCNILIHPTDPFVHIRLDRMIQDIVYKILPNVADNEFKNMQEFYEAHPEVEPKDIPEPPVEPTVSPKDAESHSPKYQSKLVSLLLLEAEGDSTQNESIESLQKRFVRVTSAATVGNVCSFLRKKLDLDNNKQVELYCCGDAMEEDTFTLENIKHKFFGDEDCLMLLQYKVQGVR